MCNAAKKIFSSVASVISYPIRFFPLCLGCSVDINQGVTGVDLDDALNSYGMNRFTESWDEAAQESQKLLNSCSVKKSLESPREVPLITQEEGREDSLKDASETANLGIEVRTDVQADEYNDEMLSLATFELGKFLAANGDKEDGDRSSNNDIEALLGDSAH